MTPPQTQYPTRTRPERITVAGQTESRDNTQRAVGGVVSVFSGCATPISRPRVVRLISTQKLSGHGSWVTFRVLQPPPGELCNSCPTAPSSTEVGRSSQRNRTLHGALKSFKRCTMLRSEHVGNCTFGLFLCVENFVVDRFQTAQ